jgi:hypothetical protein
VEESNGLEGVWDVSVTVTNCTSGAPIRTVRSLQMFRLTGHSPRPPTPHRVGSAWHLGPAPWAIHDASYWFFRYKPDGTFASLAKATDMITIGVAPGQFTAAGTIQDFDTNGVLISTGCFAHTATRPASSE